MKQEMIPFEKSGVRGVLFSSSTVLEMSGWFFGILKPGSTNSRTMVHASMPSNDEHYPTEILRSILSRYRP